MKQKITIKTIAKELGVSTSTVSKALKDSHEISTETKERIQAYANHYNYKPNSLALQLRTQKTKVPHEINRISISRFTVKRLFLCAFCVFGSCFCCF